MKNLFICVMICALACTQANADVKLPRLVSSHMVLQRQVPIPLWGWASPGESIQISFNQVQLTTLTNSQGEWRLELPPQTAGGPFTLRIQGKNRLELTDILVGDVWLASGQSNMELTLARAEPRFAQLVPGINNTQIRQFDVVDRYYFKAPLADLEGGEWKTATQDNIRGFSAVGYFFAQALQQSLQQQQPLHQQAKQPQAVPIGIINASLGGSPVEAWMSEGSLLKFPEAYQQGQKFKENALIEKIEASDKKRSDQWFAELQKKDQGMKGEHPLWAMPEFDDRRWQTMPVPGYWPDTNQGPLNGVMWFRKEFQLPPTPISQDGLLILGALVDADQAFINGVQVGTTGYKYPPRRYPVPKGLLKPGRNVLSLRITSQMGRGGFVLDKAYALHLGQQVIDLKGSWAYQLGAAMPPLEPPTFIRWQPMGLFNGMIAPLLKFPIKGAIWYQGESNTGHPEEYEARFTTMVTDWRKQWGLGDFPFLFVQLANYLPPDQPLDNTQWAELREAQQRSLSLPKSAMVVAVDAGEWNDIHPLDKKVMGDRLALAARSLAYGENIPYSGPVFKQADVKGGKLHIRFDQVAQGLTSKGALKQFEVAGEDGQFYAADATIINTHTVEVGSGKVTKPLYARYAWRNNPMGANLYNSADLPASPFRTDPKH